MAKILLRVVLGLVALVAICVVALYVASNRRMNATFDVPVADVTVKQDSATLARGERVAKMRGCTDCHGPDLSGTVVIDVGPVATVTATNLTAGANGVGSTYTDRDFVRAIRSGVRPDGSVLLVMPSMEYRALGPEDLGALIAWIRSVPPVDTEPVEQRVGPVGRALLVFDQVPIIPAELIDHADTRFAQPEPGATVEFGAYMASSCVGCHGESLTGGPVPGMPPEVPPAANLTPDRATGLGDWTREQFMHFVDTGVRPDGTPVAVFMPWQALQIMNEVEREALWLYLRSLTPRTQGER